MIHSLWPAAKSSQPERLFILGTTLRTFCNVVRFPQQPRKQTHLAYYQKNIWGSTVSDHNYFQFISFFCFLQKLGSNVDIIASSHDAPTYFSTPKEINYVDDYFSLNLKVVVCVFKSPKPSTSNTEAKPFHSPLLSLQLLLLSVQLDFPQSCNTVLRSGRTQIHSLIF